MGFESSSFEECSGDVVGEVAESECGSAQVFEAAVDDFGETVAGVGMIEVGQDVPGSAFECPAQRDELGQTPRYARRGQRVDFGLHQGLAADFVGIAVGINDVLVDAPGDFECDVAIAGEQVEYAVLLTQREQA